MTEKRFKIVKTDTYNLYVPVDEMKVYIFPSFEEELDCIRIVNALNELEEQRKENGRIASKYLEENEQLKQQLNDITLNWTQNHIEFDKDELYVKDNNTEITLKGQNLFIQVFIPQIQEYFKFNYIVTGRRLEKEYNTLKGDVE